jgi:hypothetical protein
VEYLITQYELEQGALEIQYIEEFFGEFGRKKSASEIIRRLEGRSHLILLASASLPDDLGTVVPVSFKVAHEIRRTETRAEARFDLVHAPDTTSSSMDANALHLIGGTRRDWRPGTFPGADRATGVGRIDQGFDEIIVKTKNKFYEMRGRSITCV